MKALPMCSLNIDKTRWQNYPLADPEFYKTGRVDLFIGADLYDKLFQKGVIKIDFGWRVSGGTKSKGSNTVVATTVEKRRRIWKDFGNWKKKVRKIWSPIFVKKISRKQHT